jgi:probable F420-dependent oxidoreductase
MSDPMKFGIGGGGGPDGPPIWEIAKGAEDLGFDSMWMGQHVIIPVGMKNPENTGFDSLLTYVRDGEPLPDSYRRMVDPFIYLTAVAMATSTIKLGTNICLVGQLDPLNLAKQVASLDQISGGRVLLGVGSGWIPEEADIFGVPFKRKWRHAREHSLALKALWTEEEPSFSGEYVSFPPVYSYPKPVQKLGPPILLGGGYQKTDNSALLRRVAEWGDGWIPNSFPIDQMKQHLDQLRELCAINQRDFNNLDITMLMHASLLGWGDDQVGRGDPHEMIAAYSEAGVGRILLAGVGPVTKEVGFGPLERAAKWLGLV